MYPQKQVAHISYRHMVLVNKRFPFCLCSMRIVTMQRTIVIAFSFCTELHVSKFCHRCTTQTSVDRKTLTLDNLENEEIYKNTESKFHNMKEKYGCS